LGFGVAFNSMRGRLDVDNGPFLKLAIEEVRQTVTDSVQGGEIVLEEELEPESSDQ
jgi:hypothetical protein